MAKKRLVKIALGQFESIQGDTQANLNKMLSMTDQAAEAAEIPLCPGSPPRRLFLSVLVCTPHCNESILSPGSQEKAPISFPYC